MFGFIITKTELIIFELAKLEIRILLGFVTKTLTYILIVIGKT